MRPTPATLLAISSCISLSVLAGPSLPATAQTVALIPSTSQIDPLDGVDVAVRIAGLGDGVAPSLGVFEVGVTFNSTLLEFDGAIYGDPTFGDQLDLGAFEPEIQTGTTTPGLVELFELSLDSAQTLDTMQEPAFTMATLSFTSLAAGSAVIGLTIETLGDANAVELTATATGATITIPEPGSMLAGVIAAAALALFRRRRHAVAALAAASLLSASVALAQNAAPGDLDQDGDVDRADLAILTAHRGEAVETSSCGPGCDLDADGTITALDARLLTSLCTVAGCGPAPSAEPQR